MNTFKSLSYIICALVITSCSQKEKSQVIIIKNSLNVERSFETVELTNDNLKVDDLTAIGIRDAESGDIQITQTIDTNGDGEFDQIIFQPKVAAKSEKKFEVIVLKEKEIEVTNNCYSRFVPERTDDYAWENDKVAFRVYGPTAQKMIEDSIPGGTLSSGVDAWLKRVEHPIINNWYKKETETDGTYHEDTGEGLDNFHVGISRGVGGIAVKLDSAYYYSKNYTEWKTITTGPIRTSFYLNYANWDASGKLIKESKIISLDRGSNFTKFNTTIEGSNQISAGLTLHEKDGIVTGSDENGWVSYWQPHGESELGTAIIADKSTFSSFEKHDVEAKDLSNAYAHLNVINNSIIYYAGFGWKESGQFNSAQEWEDYLNGFSQKINNPLELSIK